MIKCFLWFHKWGINYKRACGCVVHKCVRCEIINVIEECSNHRYLRLGAKV